MKKIVGLIAFVIVALYGCNGDDVIPAPTRIRFLNAVPESSFDIHSNDELLKSALAYDSLTPYAMGVPDLYNLKIYRTGTDSVLINGTQRLQSGQYYSMFFIPDTTDAAKVGYALITDETSISPKDTVKVRFLHFAPDAPTTKVIFTHNINNVRQDTIQNIIENRTYNDQSYNSSVIAYKLMPAGSRYIHFEDATTTGHHPYMDSVACDFISGRSYTIYLEGYLNEADDRKIKAVVYSN